MRFAVVAAGAVPNPTTGGGALTCYTIIRHLLDEGHEVTVVVLLDPEFADPTGAAPDERAAALRALGADAHTLPSQARDVMELASRRPAARIGRALRPSDEELVPGLVDAKRTGELLDDLAPDAIFAYHFESAAAARLARAPKLFAVGDPPHLPHLYHWRGRRTARGAVRLQAVLRSTPRVLVRLLNEADGSGAFAAHHATRLRRSGARGCEYLRTPVPDPGPVDRAENGVPTLLLLGHLRGIVTLDGLRVFQEALPYLDEQLGDYRVEVVGGYDPPPGLERLFSHPAVSRHDHTEDAAGWLRRTVLVVPTSIPLGIRVRILTAWSLGTPIVSHRANALGIPELAHGENALLAAGPAGLARAIADVAGDAGLQARLSLSGRETYERAFTPAVAAGRIERTLRRLASAR